MSSRSGIARQVHTGAGRRLRDGSGLSNAGRVEARLFSLYSRVEAKLVKREKVVRTFIDPGHKTGTSGNKHSEANPDVMTSVTLRESFTLGEEACLHPSVAALASTSHGNSPLPRPRHDLLARAPLLGDR